MAESHGWSLDGITIRELAPPEDALDPDDQNTMFHPSEVELAATTKLILADVERLKPTRVVFDSLSELRLLAGNALRYRRQILALKQFFAGRALHGAAARRHDRRPITTCRSRASRTASIAAGAAQPRVRRRAAAPARRQVSRRAVSAAAITTTSSRQGGLEVFPRLVAAEHRAGRTVAQAAERHCPSSTRCSAAASRRGRARCSSAPPAPASRRSPRSSPLAAAERGQSVGDVHLRRESGRPCSTRCDRAGHRPRSRASTPATISLQQVDPGRAVAGRVRPRDPDARSRIGGVEARRHRQPERLSERDARGALPDHPAPRAADVPRPAGRRHHPDRRPARADRHADEHARRRQLPGGRRRPAALLRDRRARCGRRSRSIKKRSGAHERTIREFRLDDGRISVGAAAARVPRHPHRRSRLRGHRAAGSTARTRRDRQPVGSAATSACWSWRRPHATRRITAGGALASAGVRRRCLRGSFDESASTSSTAGRRRRAGRGGSDRRDEPRAARCAGVLAQQPPWSDLPVLVLTRPGADSAEVGGRAADARQRHAAGAAGAGRDAGQRGAHRRCAPASGSTRSASTSPSARAPSRRCASPTAARTSSWRRSPTSCATRSRRSGHAARAAHGWPTCAIPSAPQVHRRSWSARSITSCAWSTTCSRCRGSRAA